MAAYVVSLVTSIKPGVAEYLRIARPSIEFYGGRYLTSSTSIELLEGSFLPERLVIVEFPSAARAREWYQSKEYAAARQIRASAMIRTLLLVDDAVQGATSMIGTAFKELD